MLCQQTVTLLFLAAWCLITTGIGRLCLGTTGIHFASRGEWLFLSAGLGIAVTGYTVFLAGLTGSLTPSGINLLLASLALLSVAGWLGPLGTAPSAATGGFHRERAASIVLGLILIAGLLLALTPETGKDALIYHLAVPKLYLKHQGIYVVPGNVFAGYPLLAEMHYLLALGLRNDTLAKLIHYAVLWGVLLGMALFSRHILRNAPFPRLGMLIFCSIPSVFAVSHTAYNDLFVTLFTLAALYAFFRWSQQRAAAWLILCGAFTGFAAACKYTALLAMPLGTLAILWLARQTGSAARDTLRRLALYVASALVAGFPFYLKNWIVMENPFYPFLYGLFGGRGWDPDQARLYDLFIRNLGMGRNLWDYLLLPWNLSLRAQFDSPAFDGILGPVFLVTLPFLAAMRRLEMPLRMTLAYVLLTFIFWAVSAQQIRYLIPLFPLLALAAGALLTCYRSRKAIFGLLLLLLAGSLVFNLFHITSRFLHINPLPVAVGGESRDQFLSRMLPPYEMYRFANRTLAADARIFLIYMKNYSFLCDRDCYADALFETHTIQKILRQASSPTEVYDLLKASKFTHLLYDQRYLLGDPSPLSPAEKDLFVSFRKVHGRLIRQSGPYRLEGLAEG